MFAPPQHKDSPRPKTAGPRLGGSPGPSQPVELALPPGAYASENNRPVSLVITKIERHVQAGEGRLPLEAARVEIKRPDDIARDRLVKELALWEYRDRLCKRAAAEARRLQIEALASGQQRAKGVCARLKAGREYGLRVEQLYAQRLAGAAAGVRSPCGPGAAPRDGAPPSAGAGTGERDQLGGDVSLATAQGRDGASPDVLVPVVGVQVEGGAAKQEEGLEDAAIAAGVQQPAAVLEASPSAGSEPASEDGAAAEPGTAAVAAAAGAEPWEQPAQAMGEGEPGSPAAEGGRGLAPAAGLASEGSSARPGFETGAPVPEPGAKTLTAAAQGGHGGPLTPAGAAARLAAYAHHPITGGQQPRAAVAVLPGLQAQPLSQPLPRATGAPLSCRGAALASPPIIDAHPPGDGAPPTCHVAPTAAAMAPAPAARGRPHAGRRPASAARGPAGGGVNPRAGLPALLHDRGELAALEARVARERVQLLPLCACGHGRSPFDAAYASGCCANCPLRSDPARRGQLLLCALEAAGLVGSR